VTGPGLAVGDDALGFTAPPVRPDGTTTDTPLADLLDDGPDFDVAEAYDVAYRAFGVSRRSCFLVDADGAIAYRWVGDHWLDPTLDTPPVGKIYEEIREIVDIEELETFGL
jgi:hypothetical protein